MRLLGLNAVLQPVLCQGRYLHRVPCELVHNDRELWLVEGSRDVLDEEAEGVLILLGGHFGRGEGCGRESATARTLIRLNALRVKWPRLFKLAPLFSLQPPPPPHATPLSFSDGNTVLVPYRDRFRGQPALKIPLPRPRRLTICSPSSKYSSSALPVTFSRNMAS